MDNRFFIFLIPLVLVTLLIGLQTSCGNAKKSYAMKNYTIGDNYDVEWKQVQAFEQKGLTQDAKNVVEQIFAKAEKEKNAGQSIKALLHIYRYNTYTEEQSEQKVVNDLKAKIEAAEYPVKPVLQSILAQAYWQYFNNNRYKILQRTALANDAKAPDFETWDAARFSREMTDLYMASLANEKKRGDSKNKTRSSLPPSAPLGDLMRQRASGLQLLLLHTSSVCLFVESLRLAESQKSTRRRAAALCARQIAGGGGGRGRSCAKPSARE